MWIDVVIIIFLAVCIFDGWKDGFLRSLTSLLSWVAAVVLGLLFMDKVEAFLVNILGLNSLIQKFVALEITDTLVAILSFVATVIIAKVGIGIIASLLKSVNKIPVLGLLNRLAGGLLGAGKCIVILWVIVALIMPCGEGRWGEIISGACENSRIVPALSEFNPLLNIL